MRIIGNAELTEVAIAGHLATVKRMPTGFPSPAEDMAEAPLSLDKLLAQRPASMFFVEMAGDALLDSGIFSGDVLVVDRALHPSYGAVVVVTLDDKLFARHYCPDSEAVHLLPAHPDVAPISVYDRSRYHLLGVVTGVVRRLHRRTGC